MVLRVIDAEASHLFNQAVFERGKLGNIENHLAEETFVLILRSLP